MPTSPQPILKCLLRNFNVRSFFIIVFLPDAVVDFLKWAERTKTTQICLHKNHPGCCFRLKKNNLHGSIIRFLYPVRGGCWRHKSQEALGQKAMTARWVKLFWSKRDWLWQRFRPPISQHLIKTEAPFIVCFTVNISSNSFIIPVLLWCRKSWQRCLYLGTNEVLV